MWWLVALALVPLTGWLIHPLFTRPTIRLTRFALGLLSTDAILLCVFLAIGGV